MRVLLAALLITLPCFAQSTGDIASITPSVSEKEFSYYKSLNEKEKRYLQYKDSDENLKLKIEQLHYINKSRAAYKVKAVKLDILASRVANRMSEEAAANNFSGHWNMRGEKPYHRYAYAGGLDHVSENASSFWSSADLPTDSKFKLDRMKEMHDLFMAEVAPNDGHKQNCIDAVHTHVGIGLAVKGGQFRYYEEFLDRYVKFLSGKRKLAVGEKTLVKVKPRDSKLHVYAVFAYYEPKPQAMTAAQINKKGSYPDFTSEVALQIWPYDLNTKDGVTEIPLQFKKAGSYYVHIYLHTDDGKKSKSASTKGKIQGSGLVITVE